MDPHYPPLDHGGMAVPHIRHFLGRTLGLRSSWLGRMLGVGPGRKCVTAPLALDYRIPALCDDAGKTRHDEGLERLANLYHFHALAPWNAAAPKGQRQARKL